jgi:hypothetical protein
MTTWKAFEAQVRELAAYIWDREAKPEQIAGVDIDCVLAIRSTHKVLIEITEESDLEKVRKDVNRLDLARRSLFLTDNVSAECYCVVAKRITPAMDEAGKALNIRVMSFEAFKRLFFDFTSYKIARQKRQFGSAVNPLTGEAEFRLYPSKLYF